MQTFTPRRKRTTGVVLSTVVNLRENVSLARYTTFGVGGRARWFAEASTEEDVVEAVGLARERDLPLFVLGGGSNVLISDAGFAGLVLHIGLRGIEDVAGPNGAGPQGLLRVAAGEEWDPLVAYTVARDLAGMECLSGIPGRTGGTPVQNVGAYGQEVSQTITEVRAYDRSAGGFVELSNRECGFSYRTSIFNSTEKDRYIVTRVSFQLTPHGAPNLSYADLERHFAGRTRPTLSEVRDAVRSIRHRKGMLIVEGDPDARSAGSFFRNPIVEQAVYERIREREGEVPSYAVSSAHDEDSGRVKIPAAWLIEHAGFSKGFEAGRAGLSSKHPLALINRGEARAADILALRDRITAAVQERFGIRLEPEPVFVE